MKKGGGNRRVNYRRHAAFWCDGGGESAWDAMKEKGAKKVTRRNWALRVVKCVMMVAVAVACAGPNLLASLQTLQRTHLTQQAPCPHAHVHAHQPS